MSCYFSELPLWVQDHLQNKTEKQRTTESVPTNPPYLVYTLTSVNVTYGLLRTAQRFLQNLSSKYIGPLWLPTDWNPVSRREWLSSLLRFLYLSDLHC